LLWRFALLQSQLSVAMPKKRETHAERARGEQEVLERQVLDMLLLLRTLMNRLCHIESTGNLGEGRMGNVLDAIAAFLIHIHIARSQRVGRRGGVIDFNDLGIWSIGRGPPPGPPPPPGAAAIKTKTQEVVSGAASSFAFGHVTLAFGRVTRREVGFCLAPVREKNEFGGNRTTNLCT
jgi:hypothetical protein